MHLSERRRAEDARRGTAAERGYGQQWREIRDQFIADHPICQRCNGAPSTIAHHIVPKLQGGSDDGFNLQALCDLCHAQVEAKLGTLFGGRARGQG